MIRIDTPDDYKRLKIENDFVESKNGRVQIPCSNTFLVVRDMIVANSYNPNYVPKAKMELLQKSIVDNGFCFPIVAIWDDDRSVFVIIDGFHRFSMSDDKWLGMEYIPLVVLPHGMAKRLAATMQFNKARGVHQVDLDAELIRKMVEQGLDDDEIAISLGIDVDTVHRYKQITGIAALFKSAEYSTSWEMVEAE